VDAKPTLSKIPFYDAVLPMMLDWSFATAYNLSLEVFP
jgi:hypothetical protein